MITLNQEDMRIFSHNNDFTHILYSRLHQMVPLGHKSARCAILTREGVRLVGDKIVKINEPTRLQMMIELAMFLDGTEDMIEITTSE